MCVSIHGFGCKICSCVYVLDSHFIAIRRFFKRTQSLQVHKFIVGIHTYTHTYGYVHIWVYLYMYLLSILCRQHCMPAILQRSKERKQIRTITKTIAIMLQWWHKALKQRQQACSCNCLYITPYIHTHTYW